MLQLTCTLFNEEVGRSKAINSSACPGYCDADFDVADIEISLQGLWLQKAASRWNGPTDPPSTACECSDMSMFDMSISAGFSEVPGPSLQTE